MRKIHRANGETYPDTQLRMAPWLVSDADRRAFVAGRDYGMKLGAVIILLAEFALLVVGLVIHAKVVTGG